MRFEVLTTVKIGLSSCGLWHRPVYVQSKAQKTAMLVVIDVIESRLTCLSRGFGKWLLVICVKCMQEVVSVGPLAQVFVSESKCVLMKYFIQAYRNNSMFIPVAPIWIIGHL
jgi:hypothetical protein